MQPVQYKILISRFLLYYPYCLGS